MIISDTATGRVLSEKRIFRADCPEHGSFDDDEIPKKAGHHVTFWTHKFREEFPKAVQDKLLFQLSEDERHVFIDMREGRRRADWKWLGELKAQPFQAIA